MTTSWYVRTLPNICLEGRIPACLGALPYVSGYQMPVSRLLFYANPTPNDPLFFIQSIPNDPLHFQILHTMAILCVLWVHFEKFLKQFCGNVKGPYADHILIPPGLNRKKYIFWYQMKAHIFLIANPKFQLQILCSFGDITKSVKWNGIPENNFFCIFIIASSPGVHTFFYLWRVNKKLLQVKLHKMHFRGQGQSIKSEKYAC